MKSHGVVCQSCVVESTYQVLSPWRAEEVRESSWREGAELACEDALEPSGRPNATSIPSRGTCKGKGTCQKMKGQNQWEGAAEGVGWAQAQLGRARQCDASVLSCLIQKGLGRAKCQLHPKILEEFNLGK